MRTTRGGLAGMVLLAVVAAACQPAAAPTGAAGKEIPANARQVTRDWGTFNLAQRIIDKASKGEALNIITNNQGTAIPVFGAQQQIGTQRGCDKNKSRLSIVCRLTGPATTDQTAQLAELETLLTSEQVDCLGVQSIVPDAYVDIINRYIDAGVPVFTQNTDVPNSKRFAFFALNERDAGTVNGRHTGQLVKAAGYQIDSIAMGSGGPEAPWAQDRMGGFAAGYREVFADAKFAQEEDSGLPTGPNYTTQEVIDSVGPYLTGQPNVNFFFHTDQGVEGVATVIKSQGKTGKAWASGFNVSEGILSFIDSGEILITVDQGFDNQAEAAVTACVDFFVDGKLPADPLAYLQPIVISKDGGEGRITSAEARQRLQEALNPSPGT